jgi:pilus assembly protein CpaE
MAEPLNVDELVAAIHRVARPQATAQKGRVIGVVGAKGGVGATTVAVNLATSLQRGSKSPTLLIDLHLTQGDAAILLGAEPRYSVVDALENLHRIDETYLKSLVTTTKAGVDLLGSHSNPVSGRFDAARVRTLIEFAAGSYRYVVLDCPRTDAVMLEALDAATHTVVLVNQELTSVRSASRILTSLRQRCGHDRVKVAMSRLDPRAEIGQADVERVLASPVKYVFPNDYRAAASAITRGEPLILQNHSRLASSLEEVAHDLGGLPRKTKDANKGSLFGLLPARR